MIDINELRRLTQEATPGPWFSDARGNIWRRPLSDLYENGGGVAGDKPLAFVVAGWAGEGVTGYPVENNARLIAAANPSAVTELLDRLEAAESARRDDYQNWMTALDRNAELLAKLEAAEKERDELRAMIQVALVVLDEVCGNINPERGYADELETDVKRAIAALSLYNAKGE